MSKSKFLFLVLLLAYSVSLEGQMKNLLLNIGYEEYDGLSAQFPHLLNNNTLFFAGSDGSLGSTLWKTDGTTQGTIKVVSDDVGTTKQISILKDTLLFSASRFGVSTLYTSNGLPDKQEEIAYFFDDADLLGLTVLDSIAVFLVSYEDSTQVWRTQGSTESTIRLGVFPESISSVRVTTFQNYVVFSRDNNTSNQFAPIMTNGTEEGTVYVSDFLSSYGSASEIYTAQGAGDVLFVSGSSGYVLYNDSLFQSSFLDIQHAVSINSLRIATVIFGDHYSILEFDVNTLELEGPVFLNILNGTDPIVHKGKFYFFDQTKFVRIYNPSTGNTQKISSVDIGFNERGRLIPVGDSIYYTRVWNGDADLRSINVNTLSDTYFDKGSTVFMTNHSPVIYGFNNRILYTKATDAEGKEWWVYGPENTSAIQTDSRTNDILVYSNPGSDILVIESESEFSGQLHIFDGHGITIHRIPTTLRGPLQVDISDIPSGVYYAHFCSAGGGSSVARFIRH